MGHLRADQSHCVGLVIVIRRAATRVTLFAPCRGLATQLSPIIQLSLSMSTPSENGQVGIGFVCGLGCETNVVKRENRRFFGFMFPV